MTTTTVSPSSAPSPAPAPTPIRWRSKLRPADAIATGTQGLRSRKGRTFLTAIGIAIGIASMVAVLGISSSSKADLISQLDKLGTNLLRVEAGSNIFGEGAKLPVEAPAMVRRIAPVEQASSISKLDATINRNSFFRTDNGIEVLATEPQLLDTLEGTLAHGRFLDPITSKVPTVVLGSVAAERLEVRSLEGGPVVRIAGRSFAVIGILAEMPLNPDIDRSALIGNEAAAEFLGAKVVPTSIFLRADPEFIEEVRAVLPRTVNPADPNEAKASRPSDVLEARAEVDKNLQQLLLGLGGVALLVGGVGIANVMIISVLERRSEIGLRRALGATRRHIAGQFILESATLACLGGVIGVGLGAGVTYIYAQRQGWLVSIPVTALAAGVAGSLLLGALAGLYPAVRAARLDPADAVRPIG